MHLSLQKPVCCGVERVPRCCSHHVAQPHRAVAGVVLHQRVVMCGEEGAAADPLGQLLHDGAGDGRAIVSGRASACEWVHRGAVTVLPLLSSVIGGGEGGKPTQLVEEHEGVLGGVVQDARRLAQLHKESALPCNTKRAGEAWWPMKPNPGEDAVLCVASLPAMMRSEAPSRVKTRSTGVKRSLSAGT